MGSRENDAKAGPSTADVNEAIQFAESFPASDAAGDTPVFIRSEFNLCKAR